MYVFYNPNPEGKRANDCTIRAIAKATNQSWTDVYVGMFIKGFEMKDMLASNVVWSEYLKDRGFTRYMIEDVTTVSEFADRHKDGTYILGTGEHAVAVIDGDYYDSWDSGKEVPIYYFRRNK